jgi:hypothetical protein
MGKKWDKQIPFWKSDGALIDYDSDTIHGPGPLDRYGRRYDPDAKKMVWGNIKDEVVWKPNYVFEDEMIYESYYQGRSAVGVILSSIKTGATYSMMMGDFDTLMTAGLFNGAKIRGRFTFIKRGPNFRLAPADKVLRCMHCGHARKDHVNDQCLFDSTHYEIAAEVEKVA